MPKKLVLRRTDCFEEKDKKNRNHCRITRKHPKATHTKCNPNVKQIRSSFIPKALQSLTNNGSNLLIKELRNQRERSVPFDSIPKTDETFLNFIKRRKKW